MSWEQNLKDYIIVVESPNKAPSYKKYTGIESIATVGHYKGLPKKEMGINLNFSEPTKLYTPTFQVEKGKEKVYKNIIDRCKNKKVIIATDADREGDAIAFFVYNDVKKNAKEVSRIYVREISKEAIKKAIDERILFENVNKGAYYSFLGRRLSDRLIGYLLSPLATNLLSANMPNRESFSIGRVQSPAVRLIKEKEDEIKKFVPKPYWNLKAHLEKDGDSFVVTHANGNFDDINKLEEFYKKVANQTKATVDGIKKTSGTEAPPPPYITSTLQQDASSKLGLGSNATMEAAQELFENHGITYHRTDSFALAPAFVKTLRENIESKYGVGLLPRIPNKHVNKKSQAEAHEAIRPSYNPDFKYEKLSENAKKLYNLIVARTMASQMIPMRFNKTEIIFDINGEKFKINDRMIEENGFTLEIPKKNTEKMLPKMEEGDILDIEKIEKEEKYTTPPARYTGATFIAELEKREIGRPSTYASIVETIIARGYVELRNQDRKKDKVFHCRAKGHTLIDEYFKEHNTWIIDYTMTKDMEVELDLIEENKLDWRKYLKSVHEKLGFILPKEKEEKVSLEGVSCPCCGGDIAESEQYFICKNYKYDSVKKVSSECQFILWKNNKKLDKELDLEDLKMILSDKKIKSNEVVLYLNEELIESYTKGKINKDNESFLIIPKNFLELKCPICSNRILNNEKTYTCEDNKMYFDKVWKQKGCKFSILKENSFFNIIIDIQMLEKLINKEKIDVNGREMILDVTNPFFVTEHKDLNYLDIDCPKCSKKLISKGTRVVCSGDKTIKTSSGYTNNGCDFIIDRNDRITNRELSINDVRKLISGEIVKFSDIGIQLDLSKKWCVSQAS